MNCVDFNDFGIGVPELLAYIVGRVHSLSNILNCLMLGIIQYTASPSQIIIESPRELAQFFIKSMYNLEQEQKDTVSQLH